MVGIEKYSVELDKKKMYWFFLDNITLKVWLHRAVTHYLQTFTITQLQQVFMAYLSRLEPTVMPLGKTSDTK